MENLKDNSFWLGKLSEDEYKICREKATERAFSGEYDKFFEDGVYLCKCCKEPLFKSEAKFNSGSGWPSFFEPIDKSSIRYEEDSSLFMKRVEILCSNCDSHLGHVFDDAPQTPTNQRYCVNSLSLKFEKK